MDRPEVLLPLADQIVTRESVNDDPGHPYVKSVALTLPA